MRKLPLARRFAAATAGVAALEFALIAPILIIFYFGMAEICQLMMAQRKVSHSAAAVADLVTQVAQVNDADLGDIYTAGRMIMSPFPTGSYGVRLTSVKLNSTGAPRVIWSTVHGSGYSPLSTCAAVTLKTPLSEPGESVVVAESRYSFVSPVGYILPNASNLTHRAELRPRRTDEVAKLPAPTTPVNCG